MSMLTQLSVFDSNFPNSRHLLAFTTTGLTDYAHYVTNKFQVNAPADIGVPNPYVEVNGTLEPVKAGLGATLL